MTNRAGASGRNAHTTKRVEPRAVGYDVTSDTGAEDEMDLRTTGGGKTVVEVNTHRPQWHSRSEEPG